MTDEDMKEFKEKMIASAILLSRLFHQCDILFIARPLDGDKAFSVCNVSPIEATKIAAEFCETKGEWSSSVENITKTTH